MLRQEKERLSRHFGTPNSREEALASPPDATTSPLRNVANGRWGLGDDDEMNDLVKLSKVSSAMKELTSKWQRLYAPDGDGDGNGNGNGYGYSPSANDNGKGPVSPPPVMPGRPGDNTSTNVSKPSMSPPRPRAPASSGEPQDHPDADQMLQFDLLEAALREAQAWGKEQEEKRREAETELKDARTYVARVRPIVADLMARGAQSSSSVGGSPSAPGGAAALPPGDETSEGRR